MQRYDIYYENLGGEETYLDKLVELLEGGQHISFHIDGLIIELNPETEVKKEDIVEQINNARNDFEQGNEVVERQEDESLLMFSKRLSQMSRTSNSYFSAMYKEHQIVAAPNCTDFDILYQIMQINGKIIEENKDNKEEMNANPGEDYMRFGKRVFEELKNGRNVRGHFNYVTMPFTSDLANTEEFFGSSDVFTFSSMIYNLQYVREKQQEAFDNAHEKSKEENELTPEKLAKVSEATEEFEEQTRDELSRIETTNNFAEQAEEFEKQVKNDLHSNPR